MKPGVIKVRTNPESCQGCRTCEAVCSARHFGAVNPASTGIRIAEKETLGEFSITVCQQCHEMYCAKVCPVNAIARDACARILRQSTRLVICFSSKFLLGSYMCFRKLQRIVLPVSLAAEHGTKSNMGSAWQQTLYFRFEYSTRGVSYALSLSLKAICAKENKH